MKFLIPFFTAILVVSGAPLFSLKKESSENINLYIEEKENRNIIPLFKKPDYLSKKFDASKNGSYVFHEDGRETYFLKKFTIDLVNFSLFFKATADEYLNVDKRDINIRLFKEKAWKSSTFKDEYSDPISQKEVISLFEGLDEVKTKQLLLSLSTRRDWKRYGEGLSFWAEDDIFSPFSLNDLKDLKIKYFGNFSDLKKYVKTKVKSCVGFKRSCVAKANELSIIDQDRLSFFDD